MVITTSNTTATALIAAMMFAVSGCAAQLIRNPVPLNLVNEAKIENLPDVRYWGDELPHHIKHEMQLAYEQTKANRPQVFKKGFRREAKFLAISGGGSNGAFGAGLITGWTASGKRPEFDVVTGISTGALAAPFVFVGSKFDPQLREIYTTYDTKQLVESQILAGLLGGASIADATRFTQVIAKYVNYRLLHAVAREHNKGRRLLIGTTNLDAGRPVVWDMGKIAQGGDKRSLMLFRHVLQASASIPGVFPPVKIDVTANGQTLQELHVDGGTTGQVFFLPPQLLLESVMPTSKYKNKKRHKLDLYIVMNARLTPKWHVTEATTTSIAQRSLVTLMQQQAISDLYKIYVSAEENHMGYNVAAIPTDFDLESTEPFDKVYMTALFDVGHELGRQGYPWLKKPPGLAPQQAKR